MTVLLPYGAAIAVFIVAIQRLTELSRARRNTTALLAAGAWEVGAGHYRFIVLLHIAWLAAILWFGAGAPVHLGWLGLYVLAQVLRWWAMGSLGRRWTTRIIVLPGAPPVRDGPYRFLAHPNYVAVAVEIAALPMAFGLTGVAVAFSLLNAALMAIRIPAESGALAASQTTTEKAGTEN